MLHLNSFIGELLGAELSRAISGPAITFLEYDQASWGYVLFDRGDVCDRFWNMPEIVEVIPGKCAGDVDVLLRAFSAPRSQVAPYLSHAIDPEGKAFDDDEFTLGDHWVRVDFMRRLGLSYPDPGRTLGGRYVQIHEPRRG